MRAFIATILVSLLCFVAYSQDSVIKTDSSIIKINKTAYGHSVTECLKSKNLCTYKWINSNNIIESVGFYDSSHNMIGIWKEFDKRGRLVRTEDFDKRSWRVYNPSLYPYKTLFDWIQRKGDSVVIATYGKAFFMKHVKWDFSQSGYNFEDGSGDNWTAPVDRKPATFMIRYDIQFDKEHLYDDMIEFELDSSGKFVGDEYEDIYGFEKLPLKINGFKLTYARALQMAKQKGLIETDSTKADGKLWWEGAKTSNFFNGKYRFYVTIETNTIKNLVPGDRSSITKKYEVYVFNPWSGKFIEKKKMKSIYSWEEGHGSGTGLLPDN